jgi:putative ABC transport system substrate-binding protein
MSTDDNGAWNAPRIYTQRGAKYETRSRLAALMKLLVERLATPLGNWKIVAKWLVMSLFVAAPVIVTTPACAVEGAQIAVIYPDIGEPYRGIFEKIIEGIEEKAGDGIAKRPLDSDANIGALKASLLRENTKVVIALGRQGMKTALSMKGDLGIVVGGVLTVPEDEARGQPVISLSPDPALLFSRMKTLKPATKRVFVVYDPAFNDWIIKFAKEAASVLELELVAYEAKDLRSAVKYYQEIFSAANGRSDVLWLPQDYTTVEESTVLPLVLQESWNRDIAVFSSNSAHVRRGVLFSLYPDNTGLGKSLAKLALGYLRSGYYETSGILPLRDVQSAVNLRTAKHLRLKPARLQDFDTTFSEQ